MKISARTQQHSQQRLLPLLTLAGWQVRQTWRLLFLLGIGMIAAVVIVCTGPLYAQITLNASLRNFLTDDSGHATIWLQGKVPTITPQNVENSNRILQQIASRDFGTNVTSQQYMRAGVTVLTGDQQQSESSGNTDVLDGFPQATLASHVHLVSGALPQVSSQANVVEIVITPQMSQKLHLNVGDVSRITPSLLSSTIWTLRVSGIVTPRSNTDPYWQGEVFQSVALNNINASRLLSTCLTTTEVLSKAYSDPGATESSFDSAPDFFWIYQIIGDRLDVTRLNQLIDGIHNFTADAANSPAQIQLIQTKTPSNDLAAYRDRINLALVSVDLLLLLIVGMVLLFVSLIAELLVEQRLDAIALLRSRGASRRQIFGLFAIQSVLLALIALLIGPFLSLPLTHELVARILPASDLDLLAPLNGNLLNLVIAIWPYALLAVTITLLGILAAIFRETGYDVLALRREAARSSRRPVWQRFYLDIALAILALGGYGYARYATTASALNGQASTQTLAPLALLASAFFLLACVLFFLRCFPVLLRWMTSLASRRGSVSSMLALAQMSRSPQRALRTMLLLTLATAFAIFTLVFTASQSQRIVDIADYQVGTDFSGSIPDVQSTNLAEQTAVYRALPGVERASLGNVDVFFRDNLNATVKAVDVDTYAQSSKWSFLPASKSLPSLMTSLKAQRKKAQVTSIIPAIVDAATLKALHLQPHMAFSLSIYVSNPGSSNATVDPTTPPDRGTTVGLTFFIIDSVSHIPSFDALDAGNIDNSTHSTILVDYQTYNQQYGKAVSLLSKDHSYLPAERTLNYVWLRAKPGANLGLLHKDLLKHLTPETPLADRAQFISVLQHDPLYLALRGILLIGTFTPLFLALFGSLLTSWIVATGRLSSFALLRALGSAPGQLAGVLSWEQSIVYIIIFALGILAGALLSYMAMPALILTSVIAFNGTNIAVSNGVNLQSDLPPLQFVLSPSLGYLLGGILGISILTLLLIVYLVSRPSMSQTLRLNVD
ncbi:FtsX-like permease family protein [Tengunoibacter tsumagoiensis]|uniref:ABC3 transporter permease C-terminal domain-containing protein n=1 Tax=Tengunoibacter tsumagoiensis TaxID=2014871 RepID=A0A402A1P5_9CHLR|nr:FtsX-like permease family protein [Tengunoibacter tsumagoiensis]GCE13067.1 hypothetical protein KTT_29260 [Tengunoibacter tsumagoiensis]